MCDGGDLEYLYGLRGDAQAIFNEAENLKALFRKLETFGKPVVAAINGSALGGGYEIALACHHRIALNNKRIRIGLPEVTLGLLPGAGGVLRLVRLLGLQAAFPYLSEGKRIPPKRALADGLIDELADSPDELMAKSVKWINENPDAAAPWDKSGYKLPGGKPTHPRVAQMLAIVPSILNQKTRGNYPAPQAILNAAVEGALTDFDTASRVESRYFTQLLNGQVAENMIEAFWFQLNAINAGGSRPDGFERSRVQKVGVLGAGMMGAGIAYVSALVGIDVVLKDLSKEGAEAGKDYSRKLLDKQVARKRMSPEERDAVLNRIITTASPDDLQGCDLIVEAVFENRQVKAAVISEAEAVIPETATFASNTSTLPITGLAEYSVRPKQFVGLHFFSPVDKMKLVEIIVGKETAPETLAKAFDYVKQIKKTPIVVNDSRGFYTSRVFATYVLEGAVMLAEGQHPRRIESAGLNAGMPVGPLALIDEVSLSLIHSIRTQTRRDFEAEGKTYEAHPAEAVINKMVTDLDRIGKKAGKGFYDYPQDDAKHLWKGLNEHFPTSKEQLPLSVMQERMMFIQAIETARCFEEGVVTKVADANLGSVFGWGFAPFQGGTLQFINAYGLPDFVKRCDELEAQFGKRFAAPQLLRNMAEKGERFEA